MDVIRPVVSFADLRELPHDGNRYEILEGVLAVSPSPNRKHQDIVRRLAAFFIGVEAAGHGQWYPAPFDVVFSNNNVTEPDLLFVQTNRLHIITDANVQGPPDLIVEVLSSSTRDRDLGLKAHLYAQFGVPEYWVADPDTESITVHRLTENGYHRTGPFRKGETIECPLFPGLPLPIADVFRI